MCFRINEQATRTQIIPSNISLGMLQTMSLKWQHSNLFAV